MVDFSECCYINLADLGVFLFYAPIVPNVTRAVFS